MTTDDGVKRTFETGATRDTAAGKLDFDGFFHPSFMLQFAKYMNMHRLQSDGTLRDSDNWQKGIPQDVCRKSLWRHFFELWMLERSEKDKREGREWNPGHSDGFMAAAMGLFFNLQAMVVNHIKENGMRDFDGDDPIYEIRYRKEMIAIREPVVPGNLLWPGPPILVSDIDADHNDGRGPRGDS